MLGCNLAVHMTTRYGNIGQVTHHFKNFINFIILLHIKTYKKIPLPISVHILSIYNPKFHNTG